MNKLNILGYTLHIYYTIKLSNNNHNEILIFYYTSLINYINKLVKELSVNNLPLNSSVTILYAIL